MKSSKQLLCLFIGCCLCWNIQAYAQQIIAHRGASYRAPENTLASVKLGYALGADAVEVDIHLSADKRLMVNHDKDTRRTARAANAVIADTHSDELRKLDVGSWKDKQFKGEKMPFLEEVLQLVPEGKRLVIELKSSAEAVPHLQQLLEESSLQQHQLVLISFDKEAIREAKQQMPAIPAYWLLHNYKEHSLQEAIHIAKKNGLEGLDVHYKLVDQEFMQQMKAAGLDVYVYTVNEPAEAKRLLDLGVKGITTDRPQWLRGRL